MLYLNVVATLISIAAASRTWTELVDPEVLIIGDRGKSVEFLIENDPFSTRTTLRPTAAPTRFTKFPTVAPSWIPSQSPKTYNPTKRTLQPTTTTPSAIPSELSLKPSVEEKDIESQEKINCTDAEILHEVIMRDSFGDGWDSRELVITRIGDDEKTEKVTTEMIDYSYYIQTRKVTYGNGKVDLSKIKFNNSTIPAKTEMMIHNVTAGPLLTSNPVFKGGLTEGPAQFGYACLQPNRCYHARLPGGMWSNEIQWEIRQAFSGVNQTRNQTIIVNGGSPSDCVFRVVGDSDSIIDDICPNECHIPGQAPLRPTISAPPATEPSVPPVFPQVTPVTTSTPSLSVPTFSKESKKPAYTDIFNFPVLDSLSIFPEDGWSCPDAEVLYEVVLRDEFGDGWSGRELIIERLGDDEKTESVVTTALENSYYLEVKTVTYGDGVSSVSTIRYNNSTHPVDTEILMENSFPGPILTPNPVFKKGLSDGEAEVNYICLQPRRCYHALLRGGIWSGEIEWEIRSAINKRPMVNGGSPSNCMFAAGMADDAVGEGECPTQCHLPGRSPIRP